MNARTAFTGTGSLARLALRRDRVLLPAWILVFVATAAGSAASTGELYPTAESRIALATTANANTALVALYGWIYEPTSLGAVGLYKLVGLGSALVAVLAFLITVRHTRGEEEAGRLELIGATVVGRYAALTAALLVSGGASVVLGVLTAFGLISGGLPASGSFAFGFGWALTGIVFAAIAAVAAQLTENARTANGISAAVLGVAYLIRAIGDSAGGSDGPTWLSWLSPIGWMTEIRPFAGDRWWVALVPLAFAAIAVAVAFVLIAHRDHGLGLVQTRLGSPRAVPSLRSPLALAWRLQRGSLLGWGLGFVVAGLVFGGIAANVGDLVDSDQAREFLTRLGGEKGLSDAFIATELGFVAVIVSAFGIQAATRLRAEEVAFRAEPLLVTSVSRLRWAASHTMIALVGTTLLMGVAGLTAGLTYAAQTDAAQFGRVLSAALVQLPAAWVLTAIVVLAFGFAPRLIMAGWVALATFLVLGTLGPVLRLPQWLMNVSPFAHVPRLPGSAFTATPLLWLAGVAVVGLVAGLSAFRQRDIG